MRYAIVKDGKVNATFETDKSAEAFPDIAHLLVEVDESVRDNMETSDGKTFAYPNNPPPSREQQIEELTDEQFARLLELAKT